MAKELMSAIIIAVVMSNNVSASDCGWVLWAKNTIIHKITLPFSTEDWIICDTFETFKECKEAKDEYLNLTLYDATEQQNSANIAKVMRSGDTVYRIMKQEDNENISKWESYYCLPGTLDPRNTPTKE